MVTFGKVTVFPSVFKQVILAKTLVLFEEGTLLDHTDTDRRCFCFCQTEKAKANKCSTFLDWKLENFFEKPRRKLFQ